MTVFTKRSKRAPQGFYAVEAAGLGWLATAGKGSAHIVTVLDVNEHWITLERLVPKAPSRLAAEAFGRALAVTHTSGADSFGVGPPGWVGDGFIGHQVLSLAPASAWGKFYAEQRLLPFARKARDVGNLSPAGMAAVDRVCSRLSTGQWDDGAPPARIHGDLWSGNLMYTVAGIVLIDPAAHGGHALTDLAMLELFGAPHLSSITAAYAEAAALPSGWRGLIGLHQLHPLLVHAVTHGSAYGHEATEIAKRYA